MAQSAAISPGAIFDLGGKQAFCKVSCGWAYRYLRQNCSCSSRSCRRRCWPVVPSAETLNRNDITVAARLECPFVRKVKMSHWALLPPFRHATLGISTGAEASPRPDRLGRVAREGRGRVRRCPSALAFSLAIVPLSVDTRWYLHGAGKGSKPHDASGNQAAG